MSVATAQLERTDHPMTAAGLWKQSPDTPGELVKGRFIAMPPTGHPHGTIEANIARDLGAFIKQRGLGKVMSGEVGIITQRDPDTVRGADVVYMSNERLSKAQTDGYLDVAPELVIEIISPNDRWTDINEKIGEYLACGVVAVWIIDPRTQRVTSYGHGREVLVYGIDDVLAAPDILPEFALPIRELLG